MAATSTLTQRNRLGALLGMMFGGKRDLYKIFGYTSTVSYSQAYGKYNRQDVIGRVIDAPADALWSKPPTVVGPTKQFTAAWDELCKTVDLWTKIGRIDRLAGLGEYSALFIGYDDGKTADKPVGKASKVVFLQPYSIDACKLQDLNNDTRSPDFMRPATYNVQPAFDNNTYAISARSFKADASRILHVVENPLTDELFGNPRIERIFNLSDDLLKVVGGTAETYWLTGNKGMQVDIDKEMELTKEDEKALAAEIDEYQNQLRRVLRTRGIKINPLGSDTPNPDTAFAMLISLISGATGIPKRILLGSEAGQLASDQDRNNWAERIIERRANFGEPQILRPLIAKFMKAGVLPQVDLTKVQIDWPDAFTLAPLELAQASAQRARSLANMSKATGRTDLVTVEETRTMLQLPAEIPTTKYPAPAPETSNADTTNMPDGGTAEVGPGGIGGDK